MSTAAELLVGLVILVGLVGIVVPILPGTILILAATGVWAFVTATSTGWTIFAISTGLLVISGVVKYTWPGRKLKDAGVPTKSIVVGGLFGIIGFFVIPILGLFVGFLLGVFATELPRFGNSRSAWQSTVHATKAVGLSILVELFGALLASGVWVGGALLT